MGQPVEEVAEKRNKLGSLLGGQQPVSCTRQKRIDQDDSHQDDSRRFQNDSSHTGNGQVDKNLVQQAEQGKSSCRLARRKVGKLGKERVARVLQVGQLFRAVTQLFIAATNSKENKEKRKRSFTK